MGTKRTRGDATWRASAAAPEHPLPVPVLESITTSITDGPLERRRSRRLRDKLGTSHPSSSSSSPQIGVAEASTGARAGSQDCNEATGTQDHKNESDSRNHEDLSGSHNRKHVASSQNHKDVTASTEAGWCLAQSAVEPKGKSSTDPRLRILVTSRAGLRTWLAENHRDSPGIWLAHYKKTARKPTEQMVTYDEIVEECLCFGWIDSVVNAWDEEKVLRLITPRKKGGTWSKVNKERIVMLLEAGLITETGLGVINSAKADGSWDILNGADDGIIPEDLERALEAAPSAMERWQKLTVSVRRTYIYWVDSAKRQETKGKRIEELVAAMKCNGSAGPYKQSKRT